MRNIVVVLVAIVILAVGFVIFTTRESSPAPQPPTQQESTTSAQAVPGYQGKVLAGQTSPYLEFNNEDYKKALAENKIILLNFYANWCPICRAEAPEILEGFNLIDTDKVVGFRVNFNDPETDEDEKNLAKYFKVPYQHTKIILKNGQEFSRSQEQWNRANFKEEIFKALSS